MELVFIAGPSLGKFVFWVILALLVGLFVGAQITSHEERVHDYNLEDAELDELKELEILASDAGRRVLAKLKAAAAREKAQLEDMGNAIRKAL